MEAMGNIRASAIAEDDCLSRSLNLRQSDGVVRVTRTRGIRPSIAKILKVVTIRTVAYTAREFIMFQ